MNIHLTINGKPYTVNTNHVPISDQSLNTFIRERATLSGTKVMCREGGCGACVVTVGRKHPTTQLYQTFAINSCLKPLYACNGMDITTIEGLGDRRRGYHPLQKRLDQLSGTQCGFCTPGMVMNMHGLMASGSSLSMQQIERGFSGNICRCTGYRPILDAFKSFAKDATTDLVNKCRHSDSDLTVDIEDLTGYCPNMSSKCASLPCHQRSSVVTEDCKVWHRVTTLPDLLIALNAVPDDMYMLVAGNSAQGITRTPANIHTFIDITPIAEMHTVQRTSASLTLGALVTLNETLTAMSESAAADGFNYLNDLYDHFELIASVPVRNLATLGGNLSYKQQHHEFPSDVFVSLDTADASLTIIDSVSQRRTTVTMTQFLTMSMHKQVLYNIVLPRIEADSLFRSYKIMIRAQNAHAYVNAGFCIRLSRDGRVVSARICYGGINPSFTHATHTERMLVGRQLFDNKTLQDAFASLDNELQPDWVLPDAAPEYRKNLALALFYRFILDTCPREKLRGINTSGAKSMSRAISSGMQTYNTIEANWPLTKPVNKYEGLQQTSGEVKYINDIPPMAGELWAAFAVATKVRATMVSIDASEALTLPGVRHFYAAQDIPGTNNFAAASTYFEQVFLPIGDKVLFHGQPVGMVLADSHKIAVDAAGKVRIMYESANEVKGLFSLARSLLGPLIGVADNTLYPTIHDLPTEHLHTPLMRSVQSIRGRFELQGQYHFHMETQCAVVVPDEQTLSVYSSTQFMDFVQNAIAGFLAIPANHVHMVIRRLGGAYGAKITRAPLIACATALGALKTNRPVRFSMALEANMKTIGKRIGIIGDYEVEVDNATGRITQLTTDYSQDAGCSLNDDITSFTTPAFANCYNTAGWTINGAMALTDAPSNTFCRSPGTVEGVGMIETIMEHIAFDTGLDVMAVRRINMPADSPMVQLSTDFMNSIDFVNRQASCDEFNVQNRWKKRAIAAVPMRWPAQYNGTIPAFVAIYHWDGTVTVSHGGVECGQGINTKVAQVAAFALGVPLESISVRPIDNFVSANSTLTGSSTTSEMSCYAIKKACDVLLERIQPVRDTMPAGYTWPQLIAECYAQNMDLKATSQFKDSDVPPYNVYGMAAAELQLDVLTGNCQIERVDIWEDVGESMSPHVDVGQVEGAFVMGIGYYLHEQLVYDRTSGELLTDRTWNYKPPGALDIPIDFRIKFLQNSPNPTAGVLRSKATGEPALTMSIVLLLALRHAINSARKDAGLPREWLPLGSATTPEVTFLKCGNKMSDFVL